MSSTRQFAAPARRRTAAIPSAMVVADVDFPTPPLWLVRTKTRVIAISFDTTNRSKSLCWQGHREGVLNSSTGVLLGTSASFKAVGGGVSSPNHRIAKDLSGSVKRAMVAR